MLVHCKGCNVDYDNSVWEKCPYCGGIGVEIAKTAKERETPLKEEKSKPSKKSVPPKKKRKSQDPFETMTALLDDISDEYDGEEIFNEENHSRLNKALMAIDESFEPEKDWLLIANMKLIPQKLYSVRDLSKNRIQQVAEKCRDVLVGLRIDEELCETIVQSCMSIMDIDADVKKNVDVKPIIGSFNYANHEYKTCQIGDKIWFAENLCKSTKTS